MTNEEFFAKHAAKGMIGLVGGTAYIDKSIRKLQKKITSDLKPSPFSHAFIFSGKREDDAHWVFESDLEFHRRHLKIGVQENRLEKYFDPRLFPNVALLDFKLDDHLSKQVIAEALNLLANKGVYSIREIFGVMLSFKQKNRSHPNIFSRDNSFFCSAFVQHCYKKAGLILKPDVSLKHLTPHDIYTSPLPHASYELIRESV